MSEPVKYRFESGVLKLMQPSLVDAPQVIDSWLVVNGRARYVDIHMARFARTVEHFVPALPVWDFLTKAAAFVPSRGEWFPRVEYSSGTGLILSLRPAPPRSDSVSIWTLPAADPRMHPRMKGPDLGCLDLVRERARRADADEAVLTAGDGVLLEASFAAIVWWEDNALCAPPLSRPILPSVTRGAVECIARAADIEVKYLERCVGDVARHPTWLVNALHGIRPVTRWIGQPPMLQGPEALLEHFRFALARRATESENLV